MPELRLIDTLIFPKVRTSRIVPIITLILAVPLLILSAQEQLDGSRPGIALVKPQAWSTDDQLTVVEFDTFSDRTVKSSPGAGYFDFHTAKVPSRQVPAAKVVKLIVFPESPAELILAAQRAALQKQIEEFEAVAVRIPSAKKALEPSVSQLKADAAKYDAGNVKENGTWVPRAAYYQKKAAILVDVLKPEILSASNTSEFDLENDQYFLGLKDLAAVDASVKPVVESMRLLDQQTKRKEARAQIVRQLRSPGLDYASAEALVAKLKTLQPAEDSAAFALVRSWDSAVASAGALREQISAAQAAFEAGITPSSPDQVPVISDALADQVRSAAASLRVFRDGAPPPAVSVNGAVVDAMSAYLDRLPSLAVQIKAKQYIEAKGILDPLLQTAPLIGPKTTAAMSAVQRNVATQIERFTSLRDEAKMLADGDKIEAAIKKYQEAQAVIPDPDIAARIEALKKQ